ncbi:hypothetical protein B0J15DRAFT_395768 [Fusarium solani]|uniref:Uncharacterized protein n=1 Tax=Fusarium solani TaxID=169388 RepID=A0A9P9HJW0_FUSSL|nr:uncharacterized protein B0J15DRAFT_395768 [Fusarium solani]KAH7258591.1 hypothetical protein B0J15DRAFT_395768 [Fusarium solani]
MNPTNGPVPVSFADQTSLAFQAVTRGMLGSVRVVPKRVAKPKKAAKAKATAAPRPAVASGRVTKKRGNRTARAKTPVQTAPAAPQGTAVPPPPFVPAAPQGIETPLFEQPLPPLPPQCLLGEGQSSGIPPVTGTAQSQFISPPPPPQPQYFDNGFLNLSSQPIAAAALLSPPGSQPPMQPASGCFIPQSQPIFQAAPPTPPVPLPAVGTGLLGFDGVNLNFDPDNTSVPPQELPASSQALPTPPAQDLLALPSQDLFAPPRGLLAPSQDLSTLPQDLFTLPQEILAPPQGLPTPPQDLPDTSSQDLPAPSKELPAHLEDFPSPLQDLPALDATPGLLSDEEWKEILKDMDEDLSWGVRWIIIRILNDEDRFAKVVTFILRLSRAQVQEFLEIYLREEYAWRVWEEYVITIPHMPLLEHALEKRITVPALLHYNRPALLTDNISLRDEERGVLFLEERRMHGLVALFRLFCAEPYKDFLPLRIEWEIFQDGIDKQIIHQAVELGWAKPELLKVRPAAPTTNVPVDDSPLRYQGRFAPLFGAVGQRVPLHRREGGDGNDFNVDYDLNEDYDSEETQDDDEKTLSPDKADMTNTSSGSDLDQPKDQPSVASNTPDQPATNNSGNVVPVPEPLPPLPFLPGPFGFQPCQKQEHFLNVAFCRRHPRAYRHVPGCFANSLLEEGRDWVPCREACWPRGAYVQLGPRTLQAYADIIVECARHEAGATGSVAARGMPNTSHRPVTNGRQTVTNGRVHQCEAAAAHHANSSPQEDPHQGSAENLSNSTWYRKAYDEYMASSMDVEEADQLSENGSFVDEEDTDCEMFATPSTSTLPEYRLAMLGGVSDTAINTQDLSELAPSAQLRHHLDTHFAQYLAKKSTTVRRSSTSHNRSRKKQPSSEILAEDWEGGYDIVLPEAEKDTAYCPKRGDRKKRSRKATEGGRQRKSAVKDIEKKSSETIVTEGKGNEGLKDGHSALEANKGSDSEVTEAQGTANTETPVRKEPVNTTNNGPASSSRIRIVLKSSSHTPTSPAESTTKSNSPIFGVDRNSTVASTRDRVQRAHYAWSAEEATFASISTHARFAQTADRIVKPPSMGKIVSVDMSAELIELQRLQAAFENIEGAQKAQGAQDAERAEFAGCADRAMYAVQAEAACFAVEVRDKDGDCEMKDAE